MKRLKWRSLRVKFVIGFLGGLLIYVLSIGPSYRAFCKGRMTWATFQSFYGPINVANQHGPWEPDTFRRRLLEWYEGLWYDEGDEIGLFLKSHLVTNGVTVVEVHEYGQSNASKKENRKGVNP